MRKSVAGQPCPSQYTYEEQAGPDEFFAPYLWQCIVEGSGLAFSRERIVLYHAYKPTHREAPIKRPTPSLIPTPLPYEAAEEHTLLVESPRSRKKRASLGDEIEAVGMEEPED